MLNLKRKEKKKWLMVIGTSHKLQKKLVIWKCKKHEKKNWSWAENIIKMLSFTEFLRQVGNFNFCFTVKDKEKKHFFIYEKNIVNN